MSEKSPAAFVGLGVMGYPMAGHLAAMGHPMRVYNRTFSKSAQWVQGFTGVTGRLVHIRHRPKPQRERIM